MVLSNLFCTDIISSYAVFSLQFTPVTYIVVSFLSGLAEPFGALAAWLLLTPIMSDLVSGLIFAAVAGIMVFISFDELLPAAREYGEHHLSLYGLIGGMAVMAVSLLLLI